MWDNREAGESIFTVNAPATKAAVGYIGGKAIELGNVTIAMDTTYNNWGTVTLTALDGKSMNESSNVLLVVAGRAENTGMGWNDEMNSVGTEWGIAPTIAEGLPVKITLNEMDNFKLYTLDPAGNQGSEIKIVKKKGTQVLNLGAQHKTIWYLLTRD
jgi:hypothetical protein